MRGRARFHLSCWTSRTSTSCCGGRTVSSERRAREASLPSIAFAQGENLLVLAQVAETWSCRPSDLLGGRNLGFDRQLDPKLALQIDIAAAVTLWQWKAAMANAARNRE